MSSKVVASAAIYVRLSDEREERFAIDRQLVACRQLCKRSGWTVFHQYVDDGISAARKNVRRPAYEDMLAAVRSRQVNRIVCVDVDRLYRQPRQLEELIDLAEAGLLRITTVQSDIALGTDDGVTMARVLVALANKESRNISRRVKAAKMQARQDGRPLGGRRAFGWRNAMEPEPTEAKQLNQAVDDLLAGSSLNDVARRWNVAGVLQPQTGRAKWAADGIRQLLVNPRHAGLVGHRELRPTDNGGEQLTHPAVVGKAKWPAIVPPERWEQLQAVLEHRSGVTAGVPRRRSLLTGLVFCGLCGTQMVRGATLEQRGRRRVWRCPGNRHIGGTGCGRVSIDADGLELYLTTQTVIAGDSAEVVRNLMKLDQGTNRLVDELRAVDRNLDRLAEQVAKRKLSAPAYARAVRAVEAERKRLGQQLGNQRGAGVLARYGKPGALEAAWNRADSPMTTDERREVIGAVLGRITVGSAIVRGRGHFDEARVSAEKITLKSARSGKKSGPSSRDVLVK